MTLGPSPPQPSDEEASQGLRGIRALKQRAAQLASPWRTEGSGSSSRHLAGSC